MRKAFIKTGNNTRYIGCIKGLKDFFDHHSLEESRDALWKWLNVTGSRGFGELSLGERENMLVFYTNLLGLLEAAHAVKVTLNENDITRIRE